jgi:hypothetical protein
VQSSDVFQYVWGKLFGKTQSPRPCRHRKLSKGRSWAWRARWRLHDPLVDHTLHALQAGMVSLRPRPWVLGRTGPLGDQTDRGVQALGWMIRGHGVCWIGGLRGVLSARFFHVTLLVGELSAQAVLSRCERNEHHAVLAANNPTRELVSRNLVEATPPRQTCAASVVGSSSIAGSLRANRSRRLVRKRRA